MRCEQCRRELNERLHAPKCKSTSLHQGKHKIKTNGTLWVGARAGYDPEKVYDL